MPTQKDLSVKIQLSRLIDEALQKLESEHSVKPKHVCQVIQGISGSLLSKIRGLHRIVKYQTTGLPKIRSAKKQIWQKFHIEGEEPESLVINFKGELAVDDHHDGLLYFIQHYASVNLENEKALLTINKKNKTAELLIFHEKKGETNRFKKHTYYGKFNDDINTDVEKFGVSFSSKKREGDNSAIKISSMSCFNGDIQNDAQVYYTGVYASSMNTSCGTIIIERTDKDRWEQQLNADECPPSVYWHVFNSRISVQEETKTVDENLNRRIVHETEKLKSLYDAFISPVKHHKSLLRQDVKKILIDAFGMLSGSLLKHTNEQGIIILSGLLKDTLSVQNTRLFPPKQGKHYPATFSVWNDAIRENVVNNGLHFKELVSRDFWNSELREFQASLADNPRYTVTLVDFPPNLESILNFIILEFKDGRKEVWFGWVFSKYESKEQLCFQSDDASLVRFFEQWYRDLSLANTIKT